MYHFWSISRIEIHGGSKSRRFEVYVYRLSVLRVRSYATAAGAWAVGGAGQCYTEVVLGLTKFFSRGTFPILSRHPSFYLTTQNRGETAGF